MSGTTGRLAASFLSSGDPPGSTTSKLSSAWFVSVASKSCSDIYQTSSNGFSIFGITVRTACSKHLFQRLVICIPKKFSRPPDPRSAPRGWQACATFFLNAMRALGSTDAGYEFRVKEVASPPLLHFALLLPSMHVLLHTPELGQVIENTTWGSQWRASTVSNTDESTHPVSAKLRSHYSFGALRALKPGLVTSRGTGDSWSHKRIRRSSKVGRSGLPRLSSTSWAWPGHISQTTKSTRFCVFRGQFLIQGPHRCPKREDLSITKIAERYVVGWISTRRYHGPPGKHSHRCRPRRGTNHAGAGVHSDR